METSEALQVFTQDKLDSMANLIAEEFPVRVSFEIEKHEARVHITCHGVDKKVIEVTASTDEIHKSVEQATSKLGRVLLKHKDKLKVGKGAESNAELNIKTAEEELEDGVESAAIDADRVIQGS